MAPDLSFPFCLCLSLVLFLTQIPQVMAPETLAPNEKNERNDDRGSVPPIAILSSTIKDDPVQGFGTRRKRNTGNAIACVWVCGWEKRREMRWFKWRNSRNKGTFTKRESELFPHGIGERELEEEWHRAAANSISVENLRIGGEFKIWIALGNCIYSRWLPWIMWMELTVRVSWVCCRT